MGHGDGCGEVVGLDADVGVAAGVGVGVGVTGQTSTPRSSSALSAPGAALSAPGSRCC